VTRVELTRHDIRALLEELGRRLADRGIRASVYIVGGAAIALGINERRITADVDAIFDDPAVAEEATAMAVERGLPADWLNSRVAMFLPDDQDPSATIFSTGGIDVAIASPEHVLAMKMASFRPGNDLDDLAALFVRMGIVSPEHAADMALRIYGPDTVVLPGREELILSARAVLERVASQKSKPN
jgi:hypothetical protein